MLEVQALRDAAELDLQVAANELERDLFAGVADGEIDLAEPAAADAALDRVPFERPRTAGIRKLHRRGPRTISLVELGRRYVHGRKVLSF